MINNTTGVTRGAGTVTPSGVTEFTPAFSEACVARSLVFCLVFCRSLFVLLSFFCQSLYCLSFYTTFSYSSYIDFIQVMDCLSTMGFAVGNLVGGRNWMPPINRSPRCLTLHLSMSSFCVKVNIYWRSQRFGGFSIQTKYHCDVADRQLCLAYKTLVTIATPLKMFIMNLIFKRASGVSVLNVWYTGRRL